MPITLAEMRQILETPRRPRLAAALDMPPHRPPSSFVSSSGAVGLVLITEGPREGWPWWLEDERCVCLCGPDGPRWYAAGYTLGHRFEGHYQAAAVTDRWLVAKRPQRLEVLDRRTGEQTVVGGIEQFCLSEQGDRLFTVVALPEDRGWQLQRRLLSQPQTPREVIAETSTEVRSIAADLAGERVAYAVEDGTVRVVQPAGMVVRCERPAWLVSWTAAGLVGLSVTAPDGPPGTGAPALWDPATGRVTEIPLPPEVQQLRPTQFVAAGPSRWAFRAPHRGHPGGAAMLWTEGTKVVEPALPGGLPTRPLVYDNGTDATALPLADAARRLQPRR